NHNCVICGGSNAAFKHFLNRQKTVFRSPQNIARDIKNIGRFSHGPIFILGDIRQPGDAPADELLDILARNGVKNRLMLEVFRPASSEFLKKLAAAAPDFCLEISPESHDPEVRKAAGKHYSNEDMEQTIADALDAGCSRFDVFFMVGLPQQTPQSVLETVDYCQHLLERFKGDKRLSLLIGPLAPFLDPGSLAYEQPERYGYHILLRTLEDHRQALLAPSWRFTLNYETRWMTRQQIIDTTYQAILRLTRLKAKYGLISPQMAQTQELRINTAMELEQRIDEIGSGNPEELEALKPQVDKINALRANERGELEMPMGPRKLKFLRSMWSLVSGR
ncbi:MAG: radical SAM protein, partial [Dehalococcoidales bacterium]|nr:radical SAM protein [Dehalococcoidales bacterium]